MTHVLSRLPAAVAAEPLIVLLLAAVVVAVVVGIVRDVSGGTRRR